MSELRPSGSPLTADGRHRADDESDGRHDHASLGMPLLLFGVGLGGFVDGILLHQILQWHHMLSATRDHPATTVAGIEANTLADGIFHAVAWLVVLVALATMTRRRRRWNAIVPAPRIVGGWLLVGWGAFNVVEGIVDHHLLGIHHVRDDVAEPLPWDLTFLGISAVLIALGWVLIRASTTST